MGSPRSLLSRILEAAISICASVYLLKLASIWLKEILPVIVIVVVIAAGIYLAYRYYQHKRNTFL